jgi:hypothetical protein
MTKKELHNALQKICQHCSCVDLDNMVDWIYDYIKQISEMEEE